MDPIAFLTLKLFLALLLLASASKKILNRDRFRSVLQAYIPFPLGVTGAFLLLIPLAEASLGLAIVLPATPPLIFLAATLLFAGYGLVMGVSLLRGRRVEDCGCSLGGNAVPLQSAMVWRSLVLASLVVIVAHFAPANIEPTAMLVFQASLGTVSLSVFYLVSESLLALPTLSKGEAP